MLNAPITVPFIPIENWKCREGRIMWNLCKGEAGKIAGLDVEHI